jgi:hypothetical protein
MVLCFSPAWVDPLEYACRFDRLGVCQEERQVDKLRIYFAFWLLHRYLLDIFE